MYARLKWSENLTEANTKFIHPNFSFHVKISVSLHLVFSLFSLLSFHSFLLSFLTSFFLLFLFIFELDVLSHGTHTLLHQLWAFILVSHLKRLLRSWSHRPDLRSFITLNQALLIISVYVFLPNKRCTAFKTAPYWESSIQIRSPWDKFQVLTINERLRLCLCIGNELKLLS